MCPTCLPNRNLIAPATPLLPIIPPVEKVLVGIPSDILRDVPLVRAHSESVSHVFRELPA